MLTCTALSPTASVGSVRRLSLLNLLDDKKLFIQSFHTLEDNSDERPAFNDSVPFCD